jgi:hypothetical protein
MGDCAKRRVEAVYFGSPRYSRLTRYVEAQHKNTAAEAAVIDY